MLIGKKAVAPDQQLLTVTLPLQLAEIGDE